MLCMHACRWPGRHYVLFTYERLRDVRIVYVPPQSLGKFGGDSDNYEWPRHTADFTILRAYVGPNGQGAETSMDNVPYHPSSFLELSKKGASEGDFVFLLGFPGRTQRWAPACTLKLDYDVIVPQTANDFHSKLQLYKKHSKGDREAQLKLLSSKASLANYHKRYFGKRLMLQRLNLIPQREREEAIVAETSPIIAECLAELTALTQELRVLKPRQ